MLVLTRKQQEQIRIGDQVTVTILRIKGNTVRVGIEAPRDVRVVRSELGPLEDQPGDPQCAESALSNENHNAVNSSGSAAATSESISTARRELILSIRQHLAGAMC